MTEIRRQVRIDAAPMDVAAALSGSTWRAVMSIDPVGAGSRVNITASVEPEPLAQVLEAMVLAEVCAVQKRFEPDHQARPQLQHQSNTDTNTNTNTAIRSGRMEQRQKRQTVLRRTNVTTINRSVNINATAEEVWPALADFGGIAAWNPNVKASKLTSNQQLGEGVTRECQLIPLGTVQERVTEWTEGRMMTIDIYEFRNVPAMRSSTAVIELVPDGSSTTVNMSLSYEVGLGPLGAGMNAMGMRRQFEKAVSGVLAGLKHHVETGQTVDRKTAIPMDAVSA